VFGGGRVSLRRTRADWPIVAAAWLITLLASVLLAAGPMYASAAAEAGLRRALADASVADANLQLSIYGPADEAGAIDDRVQAELAPIVQPFGGTVVRDWRGSASLALPALAGREAGDFAIVGAMDGLADHATLISGAWPADRAGSSGPIDVVVLDAVATALGLDVGDTLSIVAHPAVDPLEVPIRLAGVFAIDDGADPYWSADEQLLTGIEASGDHGLFGPFLTTPNDLLANAGVDSVRLQWRTFATYESLTVENAPALRQLVEALPARMKTDSGDAFYIGTNLPTLLGDAERSLLVSRTGVLLLMAQLAILAAYAIVLTASLLVDHRRVDTALLRSRGAGPLQVAMLALEEGLLLAVPAVLVAPWIAVAALGVLNVAGPLADVGLQISPRVSGDAYVAAAAAGLVCVALLVLPAMLAARGFAAEQGGVSRQETRTFGQRMGLDIALLAVTGIAIWQLRFYGAPLTRTVQGSLGLDPLLVAAPAIAMLAGAVVALRILPLIAEAVESAVSRGASFVLSLGSRQLARRPLRYTRSALLLMLAMAMGVFALSYSATWSGSQRDQAAYQAGADVRVLPDRSLGRLPAWALPNAYGKLPGIELTSPVERIPEGVTLAGAESADLLALDASTAWGIVLVRGDEQAEPLDTMLQRLRAGRPEPNLATVPADATYLRITPRFEIGTISQGFFDPDTFEFHEEPLDPADVVVRLSVTVIVRDAHGLLHRVNSEIVSFVGAAPAIVIPLETITERTAGGLAALDARLDGPLELAGLGIDVTTPADSLLSSGTVGIADVAASEAADGPWASIQVTVRGAWDARMSQGLRIFQDVPANQLSGIAVLLGGGAQDVIFGTGGGGGPSALFAFLPRAIDMSRAVVPAIANEAFLKAAGAAPGEDVSLTLEGAVRTVTIAGVVGTFPTTDPEQPLLIVDEPTLGLLRLDGLSTARDPDEWWLAADDADQAALIAALGSSPYDSAQVVTAVDVTRSLSADPVALGIIGALAIGFVATGLFAIVGLAVSAAVSARQRRTEFALLRALGLSGRQLSGTLWLENGSLVFVSLLAGTSLGLLIGWMVLPFVTVTQRAAAPVPPVIVQVPWDRILALELGSGLALGIAVVVIGAVLRRIGVGSILRMGED
jgi:FtsX-like permease family